MAIRLPREAPEIPRTKTITALAASYCWLNLVFISGAGSENTLEPNPSMVHDFYTESDNICKICVFQASSSLFWDRIYAESDNIDHTGTF